MIGRLFTAIRIARMSPEERLQKMRADWDRRAAENPRHYVASAQKNWTDDEFFRSGEETVRNYILTDMENICQGRDPKSLRVLEIGCGAGRETRALAGIFGDVHAVDVSSEMVRLARESLGGLPNAFVYHNSGADLAVVPEQPMDFAYSHLVFQHIPSREIIGSYVHEVHRLLRPGGLFKFQLQGFPVPLGAWLADTWDCVPFSEVQILQLASETGFESRYREGVGEQYFWNWFFKPAA